MPEGRPEGLASLEANQEGEPMTPTQMTLADAVAPTAVDKPRKGKARPVTTATLRTLAEAAETLGTSPDNLRGAIARGSLAAVKMGRDWFVSAPEVERYGRENRRGAK